MSDSNRGLYIVATLGAIIVALILGSAESRCQSQQNAYQRRTAEKPSDDEMYQVAAQRSGMPCLVESLIANPPSKDGTDKDQRDLIAQESAALWGFWIAFFALLQLAATIIGLIFIKRTLDATWRAVEDTGKATAEMQEANRIARKISAAELRPYLFVEKIEIVESYSDQVPIGEPGDYGDEPETRKGYFNARFVTHFRNFGKVPARNIRVYEKAYFANLRDGRFWRYTFCAVKLWTCAPGHERKLFGSLFVEDGERERFDSGEISYVLRLRLTFEDDAGSTFQERAAFSLSGKDVGTFYLLGDVEVAKARQRRLQYEMYMQEAQAPKAKAVKRKGRPPKKQKP